MSLQETITRALELGVDVKMITGDHMLIAKEMCRMLGMRDNVEGPHDLPNMTEDNKIPKDLAEKYGKKIYETDGFAQVFPQHKSLIVETLRQSGEHDRVPKSCVIPLWFGQGVGLSCTLGV